MLLPGGGCLGALRSASCQVLLSEGPPLAPPHPRPPSPDQACGNSWRASVGDPWSLHCLPQPCQEVNGWEGAAG